MSHIQTKLRNICCHRYYNYQVRLSYSCNNLVKEPLHLFLQHKGMLLFARGLP